MQTVLLRKTFEIIVLSQKTIYYLIKTGRGNIIIFAAQQLENMGNKRINAFNSFFLFTKLALIVPVIILYIHFFFPQNWGFFTVKPSQPVLKIYEVSDRYIHLMHNNLSFGMGTSRKGRMIYHQLTTLSKRNINLTWRPFITDSIFQGNTNENFSQVNGGKKLSIKGKFILIKEDQVLEPSLPLNPTTLPVIPQEYSMVEIR